MGATGYVIGPYNNILIPASKLGYATAADVLSGKTFTSINGVKLTGTMEISLGRVHEVTYSGSRYINGTNTPTFGTISFTETCPYSDASYLKWYFSCGLHLYKPQTTSANWTWSASETPGNHRKVLRGVVSTYTIADCSVRVAFNTSGSIEFSLTIDSNNFLTNYAVDTTRIPIWFGFYK